MNNNTNDEIRALVELNRERKQRLANLDDAGKLLFEIAEAVLEERQYTILSYNPEAIRRCISLAESMGASVEEICEGPHTQITINPPQR